MKEFTAAIATVALSLALTGCGSNSKPDSNPSTAAATTSATSTTSSVRASGSYYTIADYIKDNDITETTVHHGDPGSPTIDLAVPRDWHVLEESTGAPYGGIVYDQPANPRDPPTIIALVSKLTGNVDQAKILQFAPGELQNLPGFDGGDGTESTLGGFEAYQLGGSYTRDGTERAIAQKTVVIPSGYAVFVLQLNADSPSSEQVTLMEATDIIDKETTINP
ncbi:LpqN/LpqT family lipoprotein [Mycobacterium sp.]|uniref:LpqN/LpqT family lipoprotein n=1 Tax=Mycobacterium sp. TaxID=1785 RepID=UPI003BAA4335